MKGTPNNFANNDEDQADLQNTMLLFSADVVRHHESSLYLIQLITSDFWQKKNMYLKTIYFCHKFQNLISQPSAPCTKRHAESTKRLLNFWSSSCYMSYMPNAELLHTYKN